VAEHSLRPPEPRESIFGRDDTAHRLDVDLDTRGTAKHVGFCAQTFGWLAFEMADRRGIGERATDDPLGVGTEHWPQIVLAQETVGDVVSCRMQAGVGVACAAHL